ncbi:VWA domain-containing protein [Pseudomonas sp. CAN2814]|uniref:VWA domain-containing protein n=1 Tax=Pseudomonas sp. CAN1 TaxID=3046726 RepID=UPI002647827B|nr:VWA domain-containing protein [Pseudomonas sp. CAN1]MDN6856783.1 VWA domain-containing protein [Pseudomonas sp. CAN1]
MTLFLVCDSSGSMSEGGKPFIMRTAVTTIAQWIHLAGGGVQVRLCAWGSEAVFSDWTITDDYPEHMLVCGGTSSATALTRLLGDSPDGNVLLLTDGFWSSTDTRHLNRWRAGLPHHSVRFIKTGADANPQLKGPDVFLAEDLFAALDGWLEAPSA